MSLNPIDGGVFAIRYPVKRSTGIIRQAETLVIDTIRVADDFRVDPVDNLGVVVEEHGTDRTSVLLVFAEDEFSPSVVEQGANALRQHSDGGTVTAHSATIITSPDPNIDPERRSDIVINWEA